MKINSSVVIQEIDDREIEGEEEEKEKRNGIFIGNKRNLKSKAIKDVVDCGSRTRNVESFPCLKDEAVLMFFY